MHIIGVQILEMVRTYNDHQIGVKHLNCLLRIKAAVSYDTAAEVLCSQNNPELYLSNLLNEESINILFSSVCKEKHRTDHSEIIKRIEEIINIMKANNIALSMQSESLLQEYRLIDEVNQRR